MSRLIYLDWMRGLAVLIMLQGHAIHSWMRDDLRGGSFFQFSQMAGGLPGALFLFMTGVSLVILLKRGEAAGASLWKLVLRRGGHILLLALLFRAQQWAFYWPRSSAADLLKADILNTIAVSLAVAGLVSLLVEPRLRMLAALAGAVAAAMLTPLVWALPDHVLPGFLAGYLKGSAATASFPLFPWISYTFTGVAVGLAAVERQDPASTDRLMQWVVLAAIALVVMARFFESTPYTYYQPYDYWLTSPNLVANRTAVVLLLLAFSYGWTRLTDQGGFSLVRQLGRTSLLVYWVHIELAYGRFLDFLQHRLDQVQAAAAVAVLMGLMLLLSLARTRFGRKRERIAASLAPAGQQGQKALANPGCGV